MENSLELVDLSSIDIGYFRLKETNKRNELWIKMNCLQEEVSRAKKQLQSMLMMNLESRIVMFEDIGRLDYP